MEREGGEGGIRDGVADGRCDTAGARWRWGWRASRPDADLRVRSNAPWPWVGVAAACVPAGAGRVNFGNMNRKKSE